MRGARKAVRSIVTLSFGTAVSSREIATLRAMIRTNLYLKLSLLWLAALLVAMILIAIT
jgi:hypothetical protein